MTQNQIVVSNQANLHLPVMAVDLATTRYQQLKGFVSGIMERDRDFGIIPGTGTKPTLLKPGAEKLCTFFGLAPQYVPITQVMDWTGADHDGEPFFYIQYKCEMYRDGVLLGSGIGSCNSWEKKYRYRNADRVCPDCGTAGTIIKGREEYGGGWICFAKKGGCGAKWKDGAAAIESQQLGQVPNPNPADLVNTIDKMAQKRALVAATLITVNASDFFTQDIEDMDRSDFVDATYTVVRQQPAQSTPTASTQHANGAHSGAAADITVDDAEPVEVPPAASENPFDGEPEAMAIPADVEKAAIDWAMNQGAFNARTHATNAFAKLRKENPSMPVGEFKAKWVDDVKMRAEVRAEEMAQAEAAA